MRHMDMHIAKEVAYGTPLKGGRRPRTRFISERGRELTDRGYLGDPPPMREVIASWLYAGATSSAVDSEELLELADELLASPLMQEIRNALRKAGRVIDADYGPTAGETGWVSQLELDDPALIAWVIGDD